HLSLVAAEPWRVFVAQADIQRETVADLEVILSVEVPVGGVAAEPIGGKVAAYGKRDPQQEIGVGIAGSGRFGRVLRDAAVEGPLAFIDATIRKQRIPSADLGAVLENVPALHPGEIVAELPNFQILGLRPLVESRTRERRVAAPREIRERAR